MLMWRKHWQSRTEAPKGPVSIQEANVDTVEDTVENSRLGTASPSTTRARGGWNQGIKTGYEIEEKAKW